MRTAVAVILTGLAAISLSGFLAVKLPAQASGQAGPAAGTILTNSVGMKLAYIPAGKFMMGSPADEAERSDEELQHEVTISKAFYFGVCEVSQREFKLVILPSGLKLQAPIFDEKRGGGPEHPRENITWYQAVAYCKALSELPAEKQAGRTYRLPTEAEWEYACRAGTKTAFHFGNALSATQADFNGNFPFGEAKTGQYLKRTAKVGSYAPNAWGLYDMHGNVAEWCSDFYDKDYYQKSPKVDPKGPDKGVVDTDYKDFFRVIRGGCWLDEARACRSAYRFRAMPHDPYRLIGFRVVCEVAK
jgi:formylglycine-generating enzyme required for sulfatase activity